MTRKERTRRGEERRGGNLFRNLTRGVNNGDDALPLQSVLFDLSLLLSPLSPPARLFHSSSNRAMASSDAVAAKRVRDDLAYARFSWFHVKVGGKGGKKKKSARAAK